MSWGRNSKLFSSGGVVRPGPVRFFVLSCVSCLGAALLLSAVQSRGWKSRIPRPATSVLVSLSDCRAPWFSPPQGHRQAFLLADQHCSRHPAWGNSPAFILVREGTWAGVAASSALCGPPAHRLGASAGIPRGSGGDAGPSLRSCLFIVSLSWLPVRIGRGSGPDCALVGSPLFTGSALYCRPFGLTGGLPVLYWCRLSSPLPLLPSSPGAFPRPAGDLPVRLRTTLSEALPATPQGVNDNFPKSIILVIHFGPLFTAFVTLRRFSSSGGFPASFTVCLYPADFHLSFPQAAAPVPAFVSYICARNVNLDLLRREKAPLQVNYKNDNFPKSIIQNKRVKTGVFRFK